MALNVSIDASDATAGAQEFTKATQQMGAAADQTVSDVEQISITLRRLREAQAQNAQGSFQQLALIRQQITIQDQAKQGLISLAEAERRVGEAAIYAATGNRQLSQQLSTARQQFQQNAQALRETENAVKQTAAASSTLGPILQQAFAVFTGVSAVNVVGQLLNGIKAIAQEGIRYNATIEQQRIGLASLITAQDRIVDGQGRTVEGAEKFAAAQQIASDLMKDIQKDALDTKATTEELVDAFQQAKAPLTAAGLSLKEAQQATTLIVQAASAIRIPMHQVAQEVRAIAEGQIDVNARLANALQIRKAEVDAAKEQGRLFEFISERLAAFALAGDAVANSFSGISSSIADISSQLLGKAFAEPFELLKDAMRGVLEFLLAINRQLNETKTTLPQIKLPQTQGGTERGAGEGVATVGQQVQQTTAGVREAVAVYTFLADVLANVATEADIVKTGVQTLAAASAASANDVAALAANLVGAEDAAETFSQSATIMRRNLTQALKDSSNATQDLTSQFGIGANAAERANVQFEAVAKSLTATARAAQGLPQNLSLAAGAMLGLAGAQAQYNVEADATVKISDALRKAIDAARLAATQSRLALIEEGAAATGNTRAFQDAALSRIEAARTADLATVTNADQRAAIEAKYLDQQTALTGKVVEIRLSAEQRVTQAAQEQAQTRAQAAEAEARARVTAAESALSGTQAQIQALGGLVGVEARRAELTQQAIQQEQQVTQARVSAVNAQITAERSRQEILRGSIAMLQRVAEEERVRPVAQGDLGEALTQQRNLALITQEMTAQTNELAKSQAQVKTLQTEITSEHAQSVRTRMEGEAEVRRQREENFAQELNRAQQLEAAQTAAAAITTAQQEAVQAGLADRITLEEAQLNLLRAQGVSSATLAEAEQRLMALGRERSEADIRAAEAAVALARQQLRVSQERAARISEQIAATGETIDLQGQLNAAINEELTLSAGLTSANTALAAARNAARVEGVKAEQEILNIQKQQAANALISTSSIRSFFSDFAEGIAEGGQKLGSIFDDLGQAVGARFFSQLLVGKEEGFDKPLIANVTDLFGLHGGGLLGGLMQQGGQGLFGNLFSGAQSGLTAAGQRLGGLFGTSFGETAGETGVADFSNVIAGSSSTAASAGSAFGTIFGGVAAGAAGLALGKGLGSMFGAGGAEAGMGGTAGGLVGGIAGGILGIAGGPAGVALGAGIGSAFGSLFGTLIGGLFASTPTRGSQIRKGVKDFLQEIEVSFADEIDSGNYFFKETKKLAEKMFGGSDGKDFLAASQVVLRDKIGPELSNQLQALGAFITAEQAQKLGKSVEQTGTTFGNLLLDNLGVDPQVIGGAIQEIVQKAGITFETLTTKLNSLFEDNLIGLEYYTDAIMGTVDLFKSDLPEAINVSAIALRNFNDAGIFDVDKFNADLKKVTGSFEVITQAFVDVVRNSKPGEDIGKMLGEQINRGLRDLAVTAYLNDFIKNELFAGIDLSDGLGANEMELLTTRAGSARVAVDAIVDSFGALGDSVEVAAEKATDLFETIRSLSQARFDLRLEVIGNLQSIGALSGADVARSRIAAFAPQVAPFANAGQLGAGDLSGLSDLQLEQGIEAVRNTRAAVVELFQAQEQEAQNALQNRIRDINIDYAARKTVLQKEADDAQARINTRIEQIGRESDRTQALFDVRQEDLQRRAQAEEEEANRHRARLDIERQQTEEIFQLRLDDLQKELQIAQSFKQVAESLQQTINGLVTAASPFSKPEQLGVFQRQATELRGRIGAAPREEQAGLIQELSSVLSSQLGIGKEFLDPTAFNNLFTTVVGELEQLRNQTIAEGNRVEQIQQQIAETTVQMNVHLRSIDIQVEQARTDAQRAQQEFQQQSREIQAEAREAAQQSQELQRQVQIEAHAAQVEFQRQAEELSRQEQAALALADQASTAEITLLRIATVEEIRRLAVIEDQLLAEQLRRAHEVTQLSFEQLAVLNQINQGIDNLTSSIVGFLDSTISAASGFEGTVKKPQLFLAHANEHVSIGPGSGKSITVSAPINMPITITASGEGAAIDPRMIEEIALARIKQAINRELKAELKKAVKETF